MQNEIVELYLDDIIPNRFQPREKFDEEALRELSTSIRIHGVIQPIIVRKIGEKYEIIAGERRYKAAALAGLTKIPAIIRNLDDKEASKVALLENLQRKDLTAIEEARTYQKILDLDSMTQEELGRTMGKSQGAIANKLRLLALTDEVQEALLNDQISERHARSLLNITDPNQQVELLNKVIQERMTVRELDQEIKFMKKPIEEYINPNRDETQNDEDKKFTENLPTIEDLLRKEEVPEVVEKPKEEEHEPLFSPTFVPNYTATQQTPIIIEDDIETLASPKPNLKPINKEEELNKFKLTDAIKIVRNVVPEIRENGMKAEVQEYDLGEKYQIIINIDKTEEL